MRVFGKAISGTLAVLAAGALLGAGVAAFVIGAVQKTPGTAAGRDSAPAQRMEPALSLVIAESASMGRSIDVIGEARALKSVSLTSEVTGIVTEVRVSSGKAVAQGDVLLKLDDQQQRIALDRALAQYPIAKENAERYASLAETEAASALEAEAAFNNFKTVEADMRAARFEIEQRTIRAPFDGVSGLTTIEPGDYLRAGDMIATLDDISSIIIEFSVPQETANAVAIGQDVTAQPARWTGEAQHGLISAIDSRVDAVSRTLKVEASFANEGGVLLPGAVYAVSTLSKGALAVAVPGLALQWDRAGAYVWKRAPDGGARRADVAILQRQEQRVLVEGAVRPGDVIVSEGADRVRPGRILPDLPKLQREDAASAGSFSASGN